MLVEEVQLDWKEALMKLLDPGHGFTFETEKGEVLFATFNGWGNTEEYVAVSQGDENQKLHIEDIRRVWRGQKRIPLI